MIKKHTVEGSIIEKQTVPTYENLVGVLNINPGEFVYRYVHNGKIFKGISWTGAKALAIYFGISITDVDIKETENCFMAIAKAELDGRTGYGCYYQQKKIKLQDGRVKNDETAAVKALNKAQRNAILNLLPVSKVIAEEVIYKRPGEEQEHEEEREIDAGKMKIETFEIESETDPLTKYIMQHNHNTDKWECSCPSFIFRGEECKHIKRKKEGGTCN